MKILSLHVKRDNGKEYADESKKDNRTWSIDPKAPISTCCRAPVEYMRLPLILVGGRKPAIKKLRRCSQCKRDQYAEIQRGDR